MTDILAKPLTADEVADRLRQYADPTNDHGVYPLLIEKHEAAVIVATIEQQQEQIEKLSVGLRIASNSCGDVTTIGRFSKVVDPVRWVEQLKAHIDEALQ